MHDPVEIRDRIETLARRVAGRSDYGTLLRRGEVIRCPASVVDTAAWRAEIKREARADRIRVRTGANEDVVWAYLVDRPDEDPEASMRMTELLGELVPVTVRAGHEPSVVIRDDEEIVCRCRRCAAEGYACSGDAVAGGELFDSDCPFDQPPEMTLLAYCFCPGEVRRRS